jgi:hypothetical protein
VTIPNGWDSDDFAAPAPERDDGRFRIVYSGYSHVAAGLRERRRSKLRRRLGGSIRGLEVLARSHIYLAAALDEIAARAPATAERVELHLAGASPAAGVECSVDVVEHGYLVHDRAVALVRSADLLFLPMQGLAAGVRTRTVPGKTYEYLAAARPILAALPDGDARDLVAGFGHVHLCRPTDVEGMRDAILAELRAPSEPPADLRARIGHLERQALTEDLAALFDSTLERSGR